MLSLYILTGAFVGFAVGLTGIGGGSLMTPLLLLFGFSPATAIGTDLLYAATTKAGAAWQHAKRGNVDWRLATWIVLGSLPASLLTTLCLAYFGTGPQLITLLTASLGFMLIVTALVLLSRPWLASLHHSSSVLLLLRRWHRTTAIGIGVLLGVLVTLSSVGAGCVATALLLLLYPALQSARLVGTELLHAVPLTLLAGLGHLWLGHVDFLLLLCLLIGSLPAVHLGARLGSHLPDPLLQRLLAFLLLLLGLKYVMS